MDMVLFGVKFRKIDSAWHFKSAITGEYKLFSINLQPEKSREYLVHGMLHEIARLRKELEEQAQKQP